MKLLMEKMYYISYGKKIDRAVYCKKILDIVPVSFLIPKIPKYLDEILYKSHFAKCGYGVIIFISIYFLLFSERRTL